MVSRYKNLLSAESSSASYSVIASNCDFLPVKVISANLFAVSPGLASGLVIKLYPITLSVLNAAGRPDALVDTT